MEPGEYHTLAQVEDQHWWYAGMRAMAQAWLPPLPTSARILEAGCGVGGGLKWLAAAGTVTGVDMHPLAVRYARTHSPNVAQASILNLPFTGPSFHLVTCFDVLYHAGVADDTAALRELARVLVPGGWLLVRVPAHNHLRGAHDTQVHTRHRYTAPEIRTKLMRAGLRPHRVSYANTLLLPLAVMRRWLSAGHAAQSDVVLPAPWLNTLLTQVLRLEARWLAHFNLPVGLSVMALARKESGEWTVTMDSD